MDRGNGIETTGESTSVVTDQLLDKYMRNGFGYEDLVNDISNLYFAVTSFSL